MLKRTCFATSLPASLAAADSEILKLNQESIELNTMGSAPPEFANAARASFIIPL